MSDVLLFIFLVDEEYSYSSGQEIRNVDGQFLGPMTAREALYRSRNIPAVKALAEVGSDNATDFTKKLGLDFGGIYRSTDGGNSWSLRSTSSRVSLGGFGWYFGKIRVNPADENDIFLLGVDLWRKSHPVPIQSFRLDHRVCRG